mmetsp:Transcript_30152/g.76219  ORF Transcript_30152/g.76219 Transcript_30152/m.76219 type:complete len:235 (-) Transcript_30152:1108-1812(-)
MQSPQLCCRVMLPQHSESMEAEGKHGTVGTEATAKRRSRPPTPLSHTLPTPWLFLPCAFLGFLATILAIWCACGKQVPRLEGPVKRGCDKSMLPVRVCDGDRDLATVSVMGHTVQHKLPVIPLSPPLQQTALCRAFRVEALASGILPGLTSEQTSGPGAESHLAEVPTLHGISTVHRVATLKLQGSRWDDLPNVVQELHTAPTACHRHPAARKWIQRGAPQGSDGLGRILFGPN